MVADEPCRTAEGWWISVFNGLLAQGELYLRYEEKPQAGMRLGRNMWLDGNSLKYMVENDVHEMGKPLRAQGWERVLPVLNQGDLGSCTANAGTGALGTQPFYDAAGQDVLPKGATAAEKFAVALYSDATDADGYPGKYPPSDTGSSGLAVCKVLKRRGTITGYRWARSPYGFLRLLQDGPVLQGMPWYAAFYEPDRNGFIDADDRWPSSECVGGHEVEAIGVELDSRDAFDSVITYVNSWGTRWGDHGKFRMRLRSYERLSGVDLKQFRV